MYVKSRAECRNLFSSIRRPPPGGLVWHRDFLSCDRHQPLIPAVSALRSGTGKVSSDVRQITIEIQGLNVAEAIGQLCMHPFLDWLEGFVASRSGMTSIKIHSKTHGPTIRASSTSSRHGVPRCGPKLASQVPDRYDVLNQS